ncbi:unnamed protein product, partial [Iphiclides podalirius]
MLAKLLVLGLVAYASAAVKMQEVFSWNVMDWNYPDEYLKQEALVTGSLIPENALPVGIERWRNKLFVSVPRWRPGIPATLNYIPLDAPHEQSPKLNPYPSYKGNELGNCDTGLNTVYRIKADKCDRLWVLDVGTYGYDPNVTNLCPYSLNVYDLNTDTRIRQYVFRPEDIVPSTFIANIALDEGATCEDTFAYFSDELGYGLIAYSWQENRSWRFSHSYFMPDPLVGDFNIAGLNFQWGAEGIFGITASPVRADGFRTLYFSPLSSHTEFAVSTRILRDETKVKGGSFNDFKVVGVRGSNGHTTSKVMDDSGVQLYNLIDQNSIGCWSSHLPLKPQNTAVVDKDDVGLVFPCDVKIDDEKNVWVISDRMPVFLESELDYSDINFRIYTAPLYNLIQGTVCEPPSTIMPTVGPMPLMNTKIIEQTPLYGLSLNLPPIPVQPSYYTSVSLNGQRLRSYNQAPLSASSMASFLDVPRQTSYSMSRKANLNGFNKPWWQRGKYEVRERGQY